MIFLIFFFKQKTAYEMRISDWSADVCSSDLHNRFFFPERNATMSALTLGTIIVEAGETSGTLTQARAAFHQGRKLFILDSCFQRTDITWPARFEKDGAIRVRTTDDKIGRAHV